MAMEAGDWGVSREILEKYLKTGWAGRRILYEDMTDSTNHMLRRAAGEGAPHGTIAVADMQTAGRGRRGRTWESPAGSSIYMSILLRPDIAPEKTSMLTLVAALSAAEGIRQFTGGLMPMIKWPNDIILNGKKLAGILTEMSARSRQAACVITGIGINVNTPEFPGELAETATSLRMECGRVLNRASVIAAVLERLEENYETFLKTEDLTGLLDRYSAVLINRDRDVLIHASGGVYRAHASGITDTGELVVQKPDGTVEKIYAGDVSVRGICGYA